MENEQQENKPEEHEQGGEHEQQAPEAENGSVPNTELNAEEGNENGLKTPSELGSIGRFMDETNAQVQALADTLGKVKLEMSKVIIGNEQHIEMLMVALLSGGNVLIEGVPGIAKTLTARMLAKTISTEFTRIQFTPDLMPTDIIGPTIFNMKTSEFEFKEGPIFSNIILIDEINRAPAKTQAALMEVMEERQVTVEGTTYPMEFPFFIIATQNPVEQEGTYKLPEAQMDRFIFRLFMEYPELDNEKRILARFETGSNEEPEDTVRAVVNAEELKACMDAVSSVQVNDGLIDYVARIVVATRDSGDLYLGASPRASLSMLKTAKAIALIRGRTFVIPDDIKDVAFSVLNHRLILTHEREMEGTTVADVVKDIIEGIELPR